MPLQDHALGIFSVLACISCASAPSVALRSPVSQHCAEVGLRDCAALSEGVMLYVDGREAEALPRLSAATRGNSKEALGKFTQRLSTLEQEPLGAKHSASIQGVVDTINRLVSQNAKRHPHAKSDDGAGRRRDGEQKRHTPARSMTADSDPAQLRDGLEVSPTATLGWCTQVFGEGSRCATIAQGPLYLTDAVPNGRGCLGQFLAVMSGDALAARFESPLAIHGGRIFVPSGSSLIFGQSAEQSALPVPREESVGKPRSASGIAAKPSASPPSVETTALSKGALEDVSPEWSCLLYWSGFVPYSAR